MKKPEVDNCPCCETALLVEQTDGVRVIREGTVKPICVQNPHGDGSLGVIFLFWVCQKCGCKWRHGSSGKGYCSRCKPPEPTKQ